MIHECLRLLPVLHHVKQQSPIMRPRGLCRAKTVLTIWIGIIMYHSSNSSHANSASRVRLKVEINFNPSTGQLRAWQNAPTKGKSSKSVNSNREMLREAKAKPQDAYEAFNILFDLLQLATLRRHVDARRSCQLIDHPSISIASLLVCMTPNLHRACTRRRTCLRRHWDTRRAKRRHKRSCKVGSSKVDFYVTNKYIL